MSRIVGLLVALLGAVLLAVWLMGSEVAEVPDAGAATEGRENASPVADLTATSVPETTEIERAPVEAETEALQVVAIPSGRALVGSIVDPDGNPVPGAFAGLTTMTDGIPDGSGGAATIECDDRGGFVLPVPEDATRREILLVGRAAGWRPAWQRVWLDRLDDQPIVLVLERGFEIVGRVVRDGAPVAGVNLGLDIRFGTPGVFGMGEEAFWIDGRFEEKVAQTWSASDGTFRFGGLAPQEYTMHVNPIFSKLNLVDFTRQVRAPDSALEIDVSTAELMVHVVSPHGPVSGADLTATWNSRSIAGSTRTDRRSILVMPDSDVTLRAEHPNSAPVSQQVTAPAKGRSKEVTLTLDWVSRPSIKLRLDGATEADVDCVSLGWYSHDTRTRIESQALAVGQDEFFAEAVPVPPGRYDLTIGPGKSPGSSSFVLPSVVEVDVPASGWMSVRETLRLAALCSVDIRSEAENFQASVTLVDAQGHTRWQREIIHDGDVAMAMWSSWSSGPSQDQVEDAAGAAQRFQLVPAGPYTLEVRAAGHAPYRAEVQVEGGRLNSFPVVLHTDG